MLHTMQPFFMRSRYSLTTTFLLPDRGRGKDERERNMRSNAQRAVRRQNCDTDNKNMTDRDGTFYQTRRKPKQKICRPTVSFSVKQGFYSPPFNYSLSHHVAQLIKSENVIEFDDSTCLRCASLTIRTSLTELAVETVTVSI